MAMPPAVGFPVPSSSLLRFLRWQSHQVFRRSIRVDAAKPPVPTSAPWPATVDGVRALRPRPTAAHRHLSTTCARRDVALRAAVFDLEAIISRAKAAAVPRPAGPLAASKGLGYFSTSGPQRQQHQQPPGEVPPPGGARPSAPWHERQFRGNKEGPGASSSGGPSPLKPDDLPQHDDAESGGSMFNNRRTLTAKASLEPRLRCTEVDEGGNVILVDGEFKKSELIAKYGLLPRDLRKIDSSNLPHILVRPSAILLNLLHLKVLIKYDRVLLFDVYGSTTSYPQSAFMYDLQGRLQQKQAPGNGGLPYEFRALEAVLTSATTELEAELDAVRDPVLRVLSDLEDDIDRNKLRILLILSKRVSTFEQKAKLVRDAITELLEADDDLASMYLTEKTHDLFRGEDDHTEVEMLLESYSKLCDEIVQEAGNLVSSIRNTEEIIRAILDANRNSLMLLDLKFSVGTLGLAMGTFLAGLYGMNLENFIEETNWGFGTVTSMSVFFSLLVCGYGMTRLRRVQRVKMMGSGFSGGVVENRAGTGLARFGFGGGSESRSREHDWYKDDGPGSLLDARNREVLRRINMQKQAMKGKKWWL